MCWGLNSDGQLGDGTAISRSAPVGVSGLESGVRAIAAATEHTCVVMDSGGVQCWGRNSTGQLGIGLIGGPDGSWMDAYYRPVQLPALSRGVTVVIGGSGISGGFSFPVMHSCALVDTGAVKCWGWNGSGQLGDGTETPRPDPVSVAGLGGGALSIAVGEAHSCVVTSAGGVKCWGRNHEGQLGRGAFPANTLVPADVPGLEGGPVDTAELASQAEYPTVAPGAPVNFWINVRNSGNTTWRASDGYGWRGGDEWLGDSGPVTGETPPGGIWRRETTFTAPTTPGEYVYGFMMRHGTQEFGPYFFVRVTVQLPSISGRVRDGSGNAIQGVLIDAGGGRTATTDVSGNYTLSNIPVGKYTLTPTKSGYLFVPPSVTIDLNANRTGVDFTAVPYSSISVNRIEAAQVFLDHKVGTSEEIPLIAGKQTMVRVFVKVSGSTPVAGMTARLRVRDAAGQDHFVSTVINGSATATVNPDRLQLNDTINFLPDPAWLSGTVTFWADVLNQGQAVATSLPYQVAFRPAKQIKVGIVPIIYKGRSAPDNQILGIQKWAEQVYPTSLVSIVMLPALRFDGDLTCGGDLTLLLDARRRPPSIPLDLVFGIVDDTGLPSHNLWFACGGTEYPSQTRYGWQVIVGKAEENTWMRRRLFAHEVAHVFGRPHPTIISPQKPCESPNAPRGSDWPTYGNALIQEWGLDLLAGAVDSKITYDYMSYCASPRSFWYGENPVWTSPRTYRRLYEQSLHTQATSQSLVDSQSYFVVDGIVRADGTATLRPFWGATASDILSSSPAGAGYCVQTEDTTGSFLAKRCFDLDFLDPHSGSRIPTSAFSVALPDSGNVARISLTNGGAVLASRQFSAHRPIVSVIAPNGGETWPAIGGQSIRWSASDLDNDSLTYNVFYSRNGTDWVPVGMGIQDTQVNVDLAELGGGNAAKVRVEVTDGVNIASDESDGSFSVASKTPSAVILSPQQGMMIPTGNAVLLQGDAYSLEDGSLADTAYRWSSNRDGNLGTGAGVVAVLSPGEHTITLTATGGSGLSASATVNIFVGAKAYLPLIRK